jgi:hypothetical protein
LEISTKRYHHRLGLVVMARQARLCSHPPPTDTPSCVAIFHLLLRIVSMIHYGILRALAIVSRSLHASWRSTCSVADFYFDLPPTSCIRDEVICKGYEFTPYRTAHLFLSGCPCSRSCFCSLVILLLQLCGECCC